VPRLRNPGARDISQPPRGNSGPSLGHVSGEVRVYPAGPAAAGSGIKSIMSNPTYNLVRCESRGLPPLETLSRVFDRLDRDLHQMIQTAEALEEEPDLLLRCLGTVADRLLRMAEAADREWTCRADVLMSVVRSARLRLRAKQETEERGPGLKVPGSHSSPSAAAEGRVGPGGTMCPPAKCDKGVQTCGSTHVDAAVGCDPVRLAEVGAQASCEPRESPPRRKRRRNRRRRDARTSASEPSPSSDEEPLGVSLETGRGVDMPAAGTIACGGREQGGKRGGQGHAPSPCERPVLRRGRGVSRAAPTVALCDGCRRPRGPRGWFGETVVGPGRGCCLAGESFRLLAAPPPGAKT